MEDHHDVLHISLTIGSIYRKYLARALWLFQQTDRQTKLSEVSLSLFRTKNFLKFSGCRTHPLEISRYRPLLTQIGENRKVLEFKVNGTNQTKEGTRGRNPASKKLLRRDSINGRECGIPHTL